MMRVTTTMLMMRRTVAVMRVENQSSLVQERKPSMVLAAMYSARRQAGEVKARKTKEEKEEEERGVNAAGVDTDRAEDAMKASQIATRMMFPWERRQFDGGRLTWWERAYWAAFAPMAVFVVGYALSTNDWADLREGRLSPTFEERAMAEADARRRARLEKIEAERRERMHRHRREFGERQRDSSEDAVNGTEPAPRRRWSRRERAMQDELDPVAALPTTTTARGSDTDVGEDFDGLEPWEIDRLNEARRQAS